MFAKKVPPLGDALCLSYWGVFIMDSSPWRSRWALLAAGNWYISNLGELNFPQLGEEEELMSGADHVGRCAFFDLSHDMPLGLETVTENY